MIDKIKKYHHLLRSTVEGSPAFYIWIFFLIVVISLGGYALLMSLIHSMEILEFYTNIP